MSLINLLEWRYATKKMNGKRVAQAKVDAILDAVCLSASSYGLQPYKIFVVQNHALKERMMAASWNQSQLSDSSHVLVFAAQIRVTSKDIEAHVVDIAKKRNMPLEALTGYKDLMLGKVGAMTDEQQAAWAARQAYIALGTALLAAAEQQVDATPMEGFVAEEIDEILGLKKLDLTSVLLMPLGYRDAGDWLSPLPKVRKDKDHLIEVIK